MSIPDSLSFIEAAAIPEVWLTAYQLLFFVGKVEPGEVVLIHAGASGVGTAATQLVKQAGGRVLVTAGSKEKIDFVKSLGADEGFNYKEGNFAEKLLAYTKGVGVNLILDCVGGSYWEQNAQVLAVDGRWVLYGTMGGGNVNGTFLRSILSKRIQLLGSTLRTRSQQYKAELVGEFSKKSLPLFAKGEFRPIIDTVIPLDRLSEAHGRMESNVNKGKIIIQVMDLAKGEL